MNPPMNLQKRIKAVVCTFSLVLFMFIVFLLWNLSDPDFPSNGSTHGSTWSMGVIFNSNNTFH